MSLPISWCQIQKAAKGDKEAEEQVIKAMKMNAYFGHFSIFGCKHDPHCEPATEEQLKALNEKIKEATKDIQCFRLPKGKEGSKGVNLTEGWDILTLEKRRKPNV